MCLLIDVVPEPVASGPPADRGLLRRLHRRGDPGPTIPLRVHGCDLLTDGADWEAATWDLTPSGMEELAASLTDLFAAETGPVLVSALWSGDEPSNDVELSRIELIALVKSNRLGNFTRYAVTP